MKIAIVHENWEAGAARCARDLERELATRHEVAYFPDSGPHTIDGIFTRLGAFQPDVVHCHSFYSDLPYRFLAQVSHAYPTCFTVHDPRPIGSTLLACWDCGRNKTCLFCPAVPGIRRKIFSNRFVKERLWKRFQHIRAAHDLQILSPSEWLRQRLSRQELARFKSRTIPYGIDLTRFQPDPSARKRLGLAEGSPVVLHVAAFERKGRYSERKGLEYLADAFETHVIPKLPNAILAVAGEDVVVNRTWVRPLGKLSHDLLSSWLAAADIFVAATVADNFPYTVLEAMACGCPVVATSVGGVKEQVDHERTGLLVPARAVDPLGMAIVGLLLDHDRRHAYGRAARLKTEEHYGMARFIGLHEELYQEMKAARRLSSALVPRSV